MMLATQKVGLFSDIFSRTSSSEKYLNMMNNYEEAMQCSTCAWTLTVTVTSQAACIECELLSVRPDFVIFLCYPGEVSQLWLANCWANNLAIWSHWLVWTMRIQPAFSIGKSSSDFFKNSEISFDARSKSPIFSTSNLADFFRNCLASISSLLTSEAIELLSKTAPNVSSYERVKN